MSDEIPEIEHSIMCKDGNLYTASALARKLRGDITALGGEAGKKEDEAIAALAGFDEAENFSGPMDNETLQTFIDDFVEAWLKD